MRFETPDTLGVTLVVAGDGGAAFALCHPASDGPPDMQISVIFQIAPPAIRVIRVFETEIVSIVAIGGTLYCVDRLQRVYSYAGAKWADFGNRDLRPYRVNDLRVVGNHLYGIGNDRMIFSWKGSEWAPLTTEEKDLYLYDIADWGERGFVISGERGYLATLTGRELHPIEVPTNADLTCVLPLSSDRLLVTGWNATAIIVTHDEAELLDAGSRDLNFLNAVRWQDRVLIAAESEILVLDGVAFGVFSAEKATLLSTNGQRLWRQGVDGTAYLDLNEDWVGVSLAVDL